MANQRIAAFVSEKQAVDLFDRLPSGAHLPASQKDIVPAAALTAWIPSGEIIFDGIKIPLPPSANAYWRSMPCVRKGTKYPVVLRSYGDLVRNIGAITFQSDAAKDYLSTMREWAIQGNHALHLEGQLGIDMIVHPRDRRRFDAHNRPKVLLDVLEEVGVYQDDAQVIDLRVRLGSIIQGGGVVLTMWRCAGAST